MKTVRKWTRGWRTKYKLSGSTGFESKSSHIYGRDIVPELPVLNFWVTVHATKASLKFHAHPSLAIYARVGRVWIPWNYTSYTVDFRLLEKPGALKGLTWATSLDPLLFFISPTASASLSYCRLQRHLIHSSFQPHAHSSASCTSAFPAPLCSAVKHEL